MNLCETEVDRYRTCARIRLSAIQENFDRLRAVLPEGVKAMAVVKADAYGHGSVPVALALSDRADYFGVASLEEALTLRRGGVKKPILILSYTAPCRYEDLVNFEITATLFDLSQARLLSQTALRLGKTARVHLAVDTGMGRIGFSPDERGAAEAAEIARLPGLCTEGIFSHFATADAEDKTGALEQERIFDSFLALLEEKGVTFSLRHLCNSAGSMEMKKHYDLCRFGIAMYGYYPSDEVKRDRVLLTPAMEVVSHVIHCKEVPAGFRIGYGHTYAAPSPRRIATVCIGYADGFNRCLSGGKGYVLLKGKRAPVVGRVCMDQIMVDVTEIPEVQVGDEVVIMGKSGDEILFAEEFGALCYSFSYEVLCTFLPRVRRIYLP